jgi:hypothetical protein
MAPGLAQRSCKPRLLVPVGYNCNESYMKASPGLSQLLQIHGPQKYRWKELRRNENTVKIVKNESHIGKISIQSCIQAPYKQLCM